MKASKAQPNNNTKNAPKHTRTQKTDRKKDKEKEKEGERRDGRKRKRNKDSKATSDPNQFFLSFSLNSWCRQNSH